MDLVHQVAELVERATSNFELELEVRIGRRGVADGLSVEESELRALDDLLRASSHFESSRWHESQCYFYVAGGRTLRTECCFHSEDLKLVTNTVVKTKLKTLDVPSGELCYRYNLAREMHVDQGTSLEVTLPTHVRIRQRASHTYRGTTCDFRYDLSRTWSGASKSEAERRQMAEPPKCEVEIELLRRHPGKTAAHAAESMIAKATSLLQQLNGMGEFAY